VDGPPLVAVAGVVVRRALDPTSPRPHLLDGVDWSVRAGETWAVLGPNGAGKSTLLRVASGELGPTSGRVELFGGVRGKIRLPELRSRVAFAASPATRVFYPTYSVTDVVLTGVTGTTALLRERVEPRHEEEAARLLELFGIAAVSRRPFAECSQGERARAVLARSFLSGADLMLLDEPTAGLDLPGRELLVRALEDALRSRPHLGVAVATHHLEELPASVTHALLLREGRVVAAGPVAEALTDESASECFELPVRIERLDGRLFARAYAAAAAP
jgi:iron complex transport system ATP-binding protein